MKSLINYFLSSCVRSCGAFNPLMFWTTQTLHFNWMHSSASWGSLKRSIHYNPVFSFRLFSCKTNFLNSACSRKHQHRALHPPVPTLSCLQLHPASRNEELQALFRHFSGSARHRTKSFPLFTNIQLVPPPWVTSLPVLCSLQSTFLSQMFLNLVPFFSHLQYSSALQWAWKF